MDKVKKFSCTIYKLNQEEPISFILNEETFAGLLVVLLDEQGTQIPTKYRIIKGKSKHPLTFAKIRKYVEEYILNWSPCMNEKQLFFKRERTMPFTVVYNNLDKIQLQCQDPSQMYEGINKGIQVSGMFFDHNIGELFRIEGEYAVDHKILPIPEKRKENIKRYSVKPVMRKRSLITPQPLRNEANFEPFVRIRMIEKEGRNIIVSEQKKKFAKTRKKNFLK